MKLHDIEIRVITERDIDDVYEDGNLAKGLMWGVCLGAVLWFGGAVIVWLIRGGIIP